jgi:hypothetical protein
MSARTFNIILIVVYLFVAVAAGLDLFLWRPH